MAVQQKFTLKENIKEAQGSSDPLGPAESLEAIKLSEDYK